MNLLNVTPCLHTIYAYIFMCGEKLNSKQTYNSRFIYFPEIFWAPLALEAV